MRLMPMRVVISEREDGREREEMERNSVQEWRVDMIESVASLKLESVSDIVLCEMRMKESSVVKMTKFPTQLYSPVLSQTVVIISY